MTHAAMLVAVMSLVTVFIRFLPFMVFSSGRRVPPFIDWLGNVLPAAIIAMLVVYCLKDTDLIRHPFGLPEIISSAAVILLQKYRRSSILSILAGTLLYMVLSRII